MLKNLTLDRPLAILDLETTGVDPAEDRIIEISILKVWPDGSHDHKTRRVNPGIPIPPGATECHGITDADVANEPFFQVLANAVVAFLDGCDLCGYNLKRYDLRLLVNELRRCDVVLPLAGRRILDACEIFHDREPRNLTGAVKFYLQRDHEGAHGAAADVLATRDVLEAQLERYGDLPRTVAELHAAFSDPDAADFEGKFRRVDGRLVFTFGKYSGDFLDDIAADPVRRDYLQWMLGKDFFEDTKDLIRQALAPKPPRTNGEPGAFNPTAPAGR